MARKSYNSDHRRYFHVMEDILDDPKFSELGLEDVGLYIKLLAVLNRQKSRDGKGVLDRFAACSVAHRERFAYAKPAYSRLEAHGLIRLRYVDGGLEYIIPNWAKLQRYRPANLRPDSGDIPPPSPLPSPSPYNHKTQVESSTWNGGKSDVSGDYLLAGDMDDWSPDSGRLVDPRGHALREDDRDLPLGSIPAPNPEMDRERAEASEELTAREGLRSSDPSGDSKPHDESAETGTPEYRASLSGGSEGLAVGASESQAGDDAVLGRDSVVGGELQARTDGGGHESGAMPSGGSAPAPGPEIAAAARASVADQVRYAVNAVYARHKVTRRIHKPGADTLRRLRVLARSNGTSEPRIARALLLGYVARCGFNTTHEGFSPYDHWKLTSLIRPSNADSNLETFKEARRLGHDPNQPWKRGFDNRQARAKVPHAHHTARGDDITEVMELGEGVVDHVELAASSRESESIGDAIRRSLRLAREEQARRELEGRHSE